MPNLFHFGSRDDFAELEHNHDDKYSKLVHTHNKLNNNINELIFAPYIRYEEIEPGHNTNLFLKNWIKKMCELYPNKENIMFIGLAAPNTVGMIECFIYDTSRVNSEGNPEYAVITFNSISTDYSAIKGVFYEYQWKYKEFF